MSILARASSASPDQWQGFVDAYMQDMKTFEQTFGPRDTLEAQYTFLGGLSDSEMRSVARIERSGVFRGVTHQDIQNAAKDVTIRQGFSQFCQRLGPISKEILSVNWSREFIGYALDSAVDADDWIISANMIEFDNDGRGTGAVSKDKEEGIRTALDKLRILEQRIEECHENDRILIYIGDSNTDLPALLAADVGIIFGDNKSLQQTCDKCGIAIRSFPELDTNQVHQKQDKKLFRARSWDEIVF